MPLRSNGCFKCRARKIRCDLQRPGCQRCETHGVKCPGYRTENPGDIEFRDQTGLIWQRANENGFTKDGSTILRPKERSQNPSPGSSSCEDSSTLALPLSRLQSPAVNRAQLYSTFQDKHFPKNFLPGEKFMMESHFGWLPIVATMPHAQSALTHALDAISLVQLGSLQKDKRLLQRSVESYTLGLRSLVRALSNPNNVYDDQVLAASSVLCQCELYTEIRQQGKGGKGWLGHLQGLQKIITARGPQALNSRLSLMLFYQSTRTSLASSLLMRRTAFYSAPEWLAAQIKVDLHEDYSDSYRSGQQIPGLLERCDNLSLDQPHAIDDIDSLLYDCEMLRSNMRREVATLSSQTIRNGKACFVLADIDTFTAYSSLVGDRTLERAYRFTSYLTSYLYSQYWLRMFLLRTCMQQVHALRQRLVPDWTPDRESSVAEIEILSYVMNLCRCVPYMMEPSNGVIGTICTFFPVHVATQYFQARGHWQWLQWTVCVRQAVFSKGLGIPVVSHDEPLFEKDDETYRNFERAFNWIDGISDCMIPEPQLSPSAQVL